MDPTVTLYEAVGGQPFFDTLVDRFYAHVEQDPVLRPMYPRDLAPSRRRLALFLGQYWGGPTTYSDERGHPRLRARHLPFTIDTAGRDAWMRAMGGAVDEMAVPETVATALLDYFTGAADWMVNTDGGGEAPRP